MKKLVKNNNQLIIDLENTYSQNEGINASLRSRYYYASLRRNKLSKMINELRKNILANHIMFSWPGKLSFEWHIKNARRDPDNISSGGRKVILDAMQKITLLDGQKFLPNDSLKYITGFSDQFIVDHNSQNEYVIINFEKQK